MSQQGEDTKSVASKSGSVSSTDLRMSKQIEKEAENYLRDKNVPFGEPIMAERVGDVGKGNFRLITNAYPADLPDQLKVYRYDVSIMGYKKNNREVMFTKKFKDDYTKSDRRFRCRDVIESFMKHYEKLANQVGCMYNDLQSIMYTLAPLDGLVAPKERRSYTFIPEQLVRKETFEHYKLVEVKLVFTATKDCVTNLDTLIRQQSELTFANRDLAQFLDIATSQEVFFRENEHVHFSTGSSYLYEPLNFGFTENDTCAFPENQSYLGIGCQKAIHTIQGDPNQLFGGVANGITAVVVQPKKTPFHNHDLLVTKVSNMLDSNKQLRDMKQKIDFLDRYLKDIMVYTIHNPKNQQIFPIKGFDHQNANQKIFETADGAQITVAQYFLKKYELHLQMPDMPLVITESKGPDGKKRKNYFPLEVCVVCDNQRVKTNQQMPQMAAQAIRKCAVPPAILKDQVGGVARSLHLWDEDNRYLKKAGIKIVRIPLNVNADALPLPDIQCADPQPSKPRHDTAQWKADRVLKPQALIGQQYGWGVYAFHTTSFGRINMGEIDQFLRMYREQAQRRGIQLGEPWDKKIIQSVHDLSEMQQYFESASAANIAFMLCFHPDNDDLAHHEIKANERRFMIITQCVKMGTARNVISKNQRLTIENILNKTNIKLGGLNFNLPRSRIANDPSTLIIGFTSNHPAGGFGMISTEMEENPNAPPGSLVIGAPTVVGFSANVGPTRMPFDFVGDFVFQQARRQEKVNVIDTVVQRCLHFFYTTRGQKMPTNVLIYRNDCSEGQYAYLLKYEIPMLKAALKANGCDATLTFIVCNKLQNLRFFNENINRTAKPPDQNLKPGMVVDSGAVHPVYAEFFLNSHRALQGTARTPKYTVIHDEGKQDLRALEQITFDLCFGHQIIFSPISLPAPVYIAAMYAKRGRNLYNANIDRLKMENPHVQMHELNEKVSFYDQTGAECWIAEYRVNA